MNKTTKALSVIGLLVFTCIMYAINKEYTFTDLLFHNEIRNSSIAPPNAQISDIKSSENDTYVSSKANNILLFSDDFEGITPKWTFTNDTNNQWYIGTAIQNSGAKSMYISNDGGKSNEYKSNSNISIASSDVITIPAGTIDIHLQYDWKNIGELSYDYGQVWIMPATYVPIAKTAITSQDGGILVKDKLALQSTYKKENITIEISKLNTTNVKIVFLWKDDSSATKLPPLSIDNISLTIPLCQNLPGFKLGTTTANSIAVEWNPLTFGQTAEVFQSTTPTPPTSTNGISVNLGTAYTFNNLTTNTLYYIWHRATCGTGESSEWRGPIIYKTPCLTMPLPLDEGFNKNSTNLSCWSIQDTQQDSTSPSGSNIWRTNTSGMHEGDQCMYFYGSPNIKHDDWLISPTYALSGGLYKLSYYYKTSNSYTNEFEVLLSTSGNTVESFTTVLVPKAQNNIANYIKKEVYIEGVSGNVNIAWHIDTNGAGYPNEIWTIS